MLFVDEAKFPRFTMDKLQETYRISQQIIEDLPPASVNDIIRGIGSEKDMDLFFDTILEETYSSLYGKNATKDYGSSNLSYFDRLAESTEETLRCENFGYFTSSVMKDSFDIGWFHLEWFDIIQKFNYSLTEAARGHGKCVNPLTKFIMYDGTIKKIKDIEIGDLLMGPDNKPRKVLKKYSGIDEMYRIDQRRGYSYEVNSKHDLTFLKRNSFKGTKHKHGEFSHWSIEDISIEDFLKLSKHKQDNLYYGFKVKTNYKKKKVKIDPYWLGLWLGDGNKHSTGITAADPETKQYIKEYADRLGMCVSFNKSNERFNEGLTDFNTRLITIKEKKTGFGNKLKDLLKEYDILNNKHIPEEYFTTDVETRLQLLAGIIDSDGNLHCHCFQTGFKDKKLAEDVTRLANSLGFNAKMSEKTCFIKAINRNYTAYPIGISGNIHEIPTKIERKKTYNYPDGKQSYKLIGRIDEYDITIKTAKKITSIGKGEYIGITVDGDNRILLEDNTVIHNSYCYSNALPAWYMYKFKPRNNTPKEQSKRKTMLFSFSIAQAIDLLGILRESIETNDILKERLYNPNSFSKMELIGKNKTSVKVKGFGGSVRGAHPYYIIVDDGLKDNVMYSSDAREKSINYFHSVIMNLLEPGGRITVVGTPFHQSDLYGDLKKKKNWHCFEYPALFPDGRVLWPERWSYDSLMEKKASQGSLIFSRELLCKPIIAANSIFPPEILNNAFLRMEDFVLVNSRENYRIKFDNVVVGCDFAMSSAIGADSSCFSVWGLLDGKMYLMYMYHGKGQTFAEQNSQISWINRQFRPSLIYMEDNVMQKIFVESAASKGLPVRGFTTTSKKNDLKSGWPGMSILFETGRIKIPIGDENSKNVADKIVDEFGGVAFTDKGLQNTKNHDDIPSSVYLAWQASKELEGKQFNWGFL